MGFVSRIILLAAACGALLVGVQIPGFVDQYAKRVDAHFIEVQTNLQPFQDIADRFHGGSIATLIDHHEASADPTFRAEGDAIWSLYQRFLHFQKEKIGLQGGLPKQVWFVATGADRVLVDETRSNYSFGILLDQAAVVAGLVCVAVVVLVLELIMGVMRWLWLPRKNPMRT
ncbi:MAG: DUF2937 family protein [Panacagrimonas sp.]